jgi:glutamate synthase (NADPH/NADH) small chain
LENPARALADENGKIRAIEALSYRLGDADASGRARPVEIPGSEHEIPCDAMIVALGNESNPLLVQTTPGLDADKRGHILADETQKTSYPAVWAGGDIVLGAATVILAMGDGRKAAKAINEYLEVQL